MSHIFNNFLVVPIYNFFVLIINFIPFGDLGFAVIILTIVVRFVLYPLSKNSIKTQIKMRELQEPLNLLKEKYKNDQQQLALETMKFYKENDIKPFSGFFLVLIQIPIIFALYFVFSHEGLPKIDQHILYPFISIPKHINNLFLNTIDLTGKSIFLSIFVGITQFFQAQIIFRASQKNLVAGIKKDENKNSSFQEDLMKSMQIQVKYILPGIMVGISYSLGAVISLYFITSNIFSIFQELYLKKKIK